MLVFWFPKEQTECVDKLIEINTEKKWLWIENKHEKPTQAYSGSAHIKSMAHFQLNTAKW